MGTPGSVAALVEQHLKELDFEPKFPIHMVYLGFKSGKCSSGVYYINNQKHYDHALATRPEDNVAYEVAVRLLRQRAQLENPQLQLLTIENCPVLENPNVARVFDEYSFDGSTPQEFDAKACAWLAVASLYLEDVAPEEVRKFVRLGAADIYSFQYKRNTNQ